MLMILARLVRSESFWAVVKVRSPHTGPEFGYPRPWSAGGGDRGHALGEDSPADGNVSLAGDECGGVVVCTKRRVDEARIDR